MTEPLSAKVQERTKLKHTNMDRWRKSFFDNLMAHQCYNFAVKLTGKKFQEALASAKARVAERTRDWELFHFLEESYLNTRCTCKPRTVLRKKAEKTKPKKRWRKAAEEDEDEGDHSWIPSGSTRGDVEEQLAQCTEYELYKAVLKHKSLREPECGMVQKLGAFLEDGVSGELVERYSTIHITGEKGGTGKTSAVSKLMPAFEPTEDLKGHIAHTWTNSGFALEGRSDADLLRHQIINDLSCKFRFVMSQ